VDLHTDALSTRTSGLDAVALLVDTRSQHHGEQHTAC